MALRDEIGVAAIARERLVDREVGLDRCRRSLSITMRVAIGKASSMSCVTSSAVNPARHQR